jgi:hypothetical protein
MMFTVGTVCPKTRNQRDHDTGTKRNNSKALDIARAPQEAYEAAQEDYEEAMSNLESAIDPPTSVDLRGVTLREHDVKTIVKLTNKMAELD